MELNPTTRLSARAPDRLRARIDELRETPAFGNYLVARDAVLEMLDASAAGSGQVMDPSEYWSEELANLEYLLDASPLVIARLRHHCYHVTGIWPYSYRSHRERDRSRHAVKLTALLEAGDPALFVPEAEVLGGFGFELDGRLVNVDTLKFFEVMIALDKAVLLEPFRAGDVRCTIWEIGAGWGGFAYVFKTLFPNVTYVISDLPELFLFSATYLMTLFPGARFAFHPGDGTRLTEQEWAESDFVFVPAHAVDAVAPPRIDLVVNMVSFQEMTTAQVERYVAHAYDRGAQFLYSLNRERSRYNPELRGVTAIMEERYWLHEIEVLSTTYQKLPDQIAPIDYGGRKNRQRKDLEPGGEAGDYRHVVGWRRLAR